MVEFRRYWPWIKRSCPLVHLELDTGGHCMTRTEDSYKTWAKSLCGVLLELGPV